MSSAHAVTFTVTNINDSGPGSLRQAILDANSNAHPAVVDTIEFRISGCGPGTTSGDVCQILLTSGLPPITTPVKIDGSMTENRTNIPGIPSVTGVRPGIELSLDDVPGNVLTLDGDNSEIRGLVINGFKTDTSIVIAGNYNKIAGNYIGLEVDGMAMKGGGLAGGLAGIAVYDGNHNTIGGDSAADRNVVSGINGVQPFTFFEFAIGIYGNSSENTIKGNYVGTNATGTAGVLGIPPTPAKGQWGVFVGADLGSGAPHDNLIANNVLSGNDIAVLTGPAHNNVFKDNLIGTDASGTTVIGNVTGILLSDTSGNVIEGNVMGGSSGGGLNAEILLFGAVTNTVIRGNFIGTDKKQRHNLGGAWGILFFDFFGLGGSSDNLIINNTIANSVDSGIEIRDFSLFFGSTYTPPIGNSIIANSIYSNGELGIGFWDPIFGLVVHPNDFQDQDVGANNLQNYPVLSAKKSRAAGNHLKVVRGTLDSHPGKYRIEFFVNENDDPSGHGEGEKFAGFIEIIIPTPAPVGGQPFKLVCKGINPKKGCPKVDVPTPLQFLNLTSTATRIENDSAQDPLERYGDTSGFSLNVPLR